MGERIKKETETWQSEGVIPGDLPENIQDTEKKGAATETIVYMDRIPGKKRKNAFTEYRPSFMLKTGQYVYEDFDPATGKRFYHIIEITDPELSRFLDECDHKEELDDRYTARMTDYSQVNYIQREEDESGASPMDRKLYEEWCREQEQEGTKPFPMDPRIEIIRCIIQQLPRMEQITYHMLYERNYGENEIKDILGMTDSAWWHNKMRLETDIRNILSEVGYDVPTYEEIKLEEAVYVKKQGRNIRKIREKVQKHTKKNRDDIDTQIA